MAASDSFGGAIRFSLGLASQVVSRTLVFGVGTATATASRSMTTGTAPPRTAHRPPQPTRSGFALTRPSRCRTGDPCVARTTCGTSGPTLTRTRRCSRFAPTAAAVRSRWTPRRRRSSAPAGGGVGNPLQRRTSCPARCGPSGHAHSTVAFAVAVLFTNTTNQPHEQSIIAVFNHQKDRLRL